MMCLRSYQMPERCLLTLSQTRFHNAGKLSQQQTILSFSTTMAGETAGARRLCNGAGMSTRTSGQCRAASEKHRTSASVIACGG